jgi:hypothetical protein
MRSNASMMPRVELGGAECGDSCVFNDVGAIDEVKSATAGRARALMFLHALGRHIE